METLTVNYLIKDSPVAVAIVDCNMRFISHSKAWLTEFGLKQQSLNGELYYDALPQTPIEIKQVHQACLLGKSNSNNGQKFVYSNGQIQWLKWKINPWKNEIDELGGLIIVCEDITLQKRKEELLYMAEEVARIGGWEVDMISNQLYWTKITKEIHEVPHDFTPTLEQGINFYKAGEHREKIRKLVAAAMTEGKSWDTELVIVTAKGNETWVRAKGEAEFIGKKCIRLVGTFQEIDAKKKAEIKYKETAERLKIATSGSLIGVWDYNLVNNKLVWDDSMYRLYGIQKEDFIGEYEAWRSGLHPDDKERGDQEIAMAISGEKEFNTHFRVIWPSGEVRYIRAMAVTQRNKKGEAIKMVGTNWDYTQLRTTQLLLQKSEESFQGAFENSNIGMAFVAIDGTLLKTNSALNKIMGYDKDEITKLTFQELTHPEDLNKDLVLFQEIVNGKRDGYQLEKRYYHKKGHIVYTLLAVTSVKDIDGNTAHIVGQVVDISDRIKDARKLNRLLNVSKKQNDSLMNFAHIVSHNLRSHSTNLSMINGFLKKENDKEEHENLMRMLNDASCSLNETVFHLNEVIQVKTEAVEKLKNINLCSTLKNVQQNLELLMAEKKAECIIEIPKDLELLGKPAYLDSIFLNLFTNSLKYCSPDRPPIISISIHKIVKETVEIHFADNGIGIDLKRHGAKLFGMYKTFHRNKDAKGIGLFLTKNQVEAINGKITVESEVDKGTLFKIFLDKA